MQNKQKNKTGGTQDLVDQWPYPTHHFNIDPTKYLIPGKKSKIISEQFQEEIPEKIPNVSQLPNPEFQIDRKITNILFADIVGFSKLLSEDTPQIILNLFSKIRSILEPFHDQIEVINTWGDAILLCCENVEDLYSIAKEIKVLFTDKSLAGMKLPESINIRIALHSGPVFFARDPLTSSSNAYGSSINRTARMEPVTLPGNIYMSDQFAAKLKLKLLNQIELSHVGIIELPKGFGSQEVYSIK